MLTYYSHDGNTGIVRRGERNRERGRGERILDFE
jgi:hypothetical protein